MGFSIRIGWWLNFNLQIQVLQGGIKMASNLQTFLLLSSSWRSRSRSTLSCRRIDIPRYYSSSWFRRTPPFSTWPFWERFTKDISKPHPNTRKVFIWDCENYCWTFHIYFAIHCLRDLSFVQRIAKPVTTISAASRRAKCVFLWIQISIIFCRTQKHVFVRIREKCVCVKIHAHALLPIYAI